MRVYACARAHVNLRALVHVRAQEATAEPAAGACGMQHPVESNGTFMETATSSESSWSHLGLSRLACVSVLLPSIELKDFLSTKPAAGGRQCA